MCIALASRRARYGFVVVWCVFLLDLYSASNSAAGPALIGRHQAPFQSELIQPFKKTMAAFDAR